MSFLTRLRAATGRASLAEERALKGPRSSGPSNPVYRRTLYAAVGASPFLLGYGAYQGGRKAGIRDERSKSDARQAAEGLGDSFLGKAVGVGLLSVGVFGGLALYRRVSGSANKLVFLRGR